jgi:hypothetical protein
MPVKNGIQVRLWFKFKYRLDSGVRRNDGNMSPVAIDEFITLAAVKAFISCAHRRFQLLIDPTTGPVGESKRFSVRKL